MTSGLSTYDTVAAEYDRRWAKYLQETLDRVPALIEGPQPMRVLDVSCGTGQLLKRLVSRFPQADFIGVDSSLGMLRQAIINRLPANAQVVQGLAEALPARAGAYDLVISTNAFHHFLQPSRVIEECRQALKPSGQLLILDWCRESWPCRVIDRWLRLVDRAHARMYTRQELRALLSESGFVPQRAERFRVSWVFGLKLWDMMLVVATPQAVAVPPPS